MEIDEGCGENANRTNPRLILNASLRGEHFAYQCSRCGQLFRLPEDRSPKDGAIELWAAFKEHVEEEHREGPPSTPESGDDSGAKTS
jgi:hypothetical protein